MDEFVALAGFEHAMSESNENLSEDDDSPIGDKLTVKQERAIIALVNEPSIPKAALAAGVGERSLYRWLRNDLFKSEVRRARRESFTQAISLAQRYAPLAMTTLAKIAADAAAPHHARVSASIGILRYGREGIELDDLAVRIDALEEAAKNQSDKGDKWRSRAA